jgi:hypothetical protein
MIQRILDAEAGLVRELEASDCVHPNFATQRSEN